MNRIIGDAFKFAYVRQRLLKLYRSDKLDPSMDLVIPLLSDRYSVWINNSNNKSYHVDDSSSQLNNLNIPPPPNSPPPMTYTLSMNGNNSIIRSDLQTHPLTTNCTVMNNDKSNLNHNSISDEDENENGHNYHQIQSLNYQQQTVVDLNNQNLNNFTNHPDNLISSKDENCDSSLSSSSLFCSSSSSSSTNTTSTTNSANLPISNRLSKSPTCSNSMMNNGMELYKKSNINDLNNSTNNDVDKK